MRKILFFLVSLIPFINGFTQTADDLFDEDDSTNIDYTIATFKTSRIVNCHSIEPTGGGVLELKINHRFGDVSNYAYDLFGMDKAVMKLAFDYGINDNLSVGIGRSTLGKTYDGFIKYNFLHQKKGAENSPIGLAWASGMGLKSLRWSQPNRKNYFSSRLNYSHQLLIARKFNSKLSMQLTPGIVHRNLVELNKYKNTVYNIGIAGRYKLTDRTTLNLEYFYVPPNQINDKYINSFSVGFDIETGGHVFQVFFTNSTSMNEWEFIAQTDKKWVNKVNGNYVPEFRMGFNISRVFTVVDPR